jgi:hypothetical protein
MRQGLISYEERRRQEKHRRKDGLLHQRQNAGNPEKRRNTGRSSKNFPGRS